MATPKLVYRIPEVAEMLGVSRSTLYALIQRGELPVTQVGAKRRVTAKAVERYLSERETTLGRERRRRRS